MARAVTGIDVKDLQSLADEGKKQLGSGVVAMVGHQRRRQGRHRRRRHARTSPTASTPSIWCARPAEVLGGKGGGGRPDMAQAGGPDGAKAEDALKAVEAALGG